MQLSINQERENPSQYHDISHHSYDIWHIPMELQCLQYKRRFPIFYGEEGDKENKKRDMNLDKNFNLLLIIII